jgi:hypothetical protein
MNIDWKAVGWFLGGVFTAEHDPLRAFVIFLCGAAAISYASWKKHSMETPQP